MSEKPENEEFDEDDVEEALEGPEDASLEHVNKELDLAKRRGQKLGDPAWRRLERLREEKYFAEQVSDFEDYRLDDTATRRGARKSSR